MIKVAIVESQAVIRAALHALLDGKWEWEGESLFFDVVIPAVADVVLVGVDDGLDAIAPYCGVRNIAFSRRSDPFFAARTLLAGSYAYVSTASEPIDLALVIEAVVRGEYVVPPDIKQMISDGGPAGVLTRREHQVMEGLARGCTNREIAEQLQISVKTIDTHRGHVITKLGLRNNADIARFAIRHGLVELD